MNNKEIEEWKKIVTDSNGKTYSHTEDYWAYVDFIGPIPENKTIISYD